MSHSRSKSKDLWIIALLLLFTVGMAYWASLQGPACLPSKTSQPGLWTITPWPVKLAVVQMSLALLLAIFTLSRRFIAPVPYQSEGVRRRGEYLSSMAQLFQQAQASQLVLEILSAQFKRDLAALVGLAPAATSQALRQAIASRRPELTSQVEAILRQAAQLAPRPDEAHLLQLGRQMAQTRRAWSRIR